MDSGCRPGYSFSHGLVVYIVWAWGYLHSHCWSTCFRYKSSIQRVSILARNFNGLVYSLLLFLLLVQIQINQLIWFFSMKSIPDVSILVKIEETLIYVGWLWENWLRWWWWFFRLVPPSSLGDWSASISSTCALHRLYLYPLEKPKCPKNYKPDLIYSLSRTMDIYLLLHPQITCLSGAVSIFGEYL